MKGYNKYKASGVDWIGDIPEHWKLVMTKRIIKLLTDYDANGSFSTIKANVTRVQNQDDRYAWFVRATDLENIDSKTLDEFVWVNKETFDYLKKSSLTGGELLIVKRGEIGKVYQMPHVDYKATLAPNLYLVHFSKKVSTEYAFYFFSSNVGKTQLVTNNNSTTLGALYKDDFKETLFILPPVEEQKSIADYLDNKTAEINTAISKKQQLIQLLNEEKEALISDAVTKGINPDVPLKETGIEWLGKIPVHWEVKKLKHILDCFDFKRIPLNSNERSDSEKIYDYYGASGVIDKVDNFIFDGEYILIGEDGANLLARNSPLAFKATGKFWVNNHAHILKPKNGNIDYFTSLLESLDYTIWVSGSAQPKLTADNLLDIGLCHPPKTEQDSIAEDISINSRRIKSAIDQIEKEITLLEEYKASLIYEAVTGKISIA